MNERDFKIFEVTIFFFGMLCTFVMLLFSFIFDIGLTSPETYFLIALPLILSISLSILLTIKRKQYVREMLSYLKEFLKDG